MGHPLWPLFDLSLRIDDLELRPPTDDDLVELLAVAKAGVHPPELMPFAVPWTDPPSPQFERGFVQYYWSTRAGWSVDDWNVEFGVRRQGQMVGVQGIAAKNFATLRTVGTGSWLGQAYQRQGTGRLMRQAVLAFAFDHLGAEVATSAAFVDNTASSRVSEYIGYEPNGIDRFAPRGEAREMRRYRLTLDGWRTRPRPEVGVEGLEACLDMFGVAASADK